MSNQDRIANLSRRFQTHSVGRKRTNTRTRERHSLYLDGELVTRLDKEYRDTAHSLYPKNLSKSEFLEAVLEYGINHLDEIRSELSVASEQSEVVAHPPTYDT